MFSDHNMPLVVGTAKDQEYRSLIQSQPIPVRVATVDQVVADPKMAAKAVYMRAGFGGAFLSEEYLTCFKAERALKERGARIVNPVHSSSVAHRKDILYEELRRYGISVPWSLPNPSVPELLVALEAGDLSFPFIYRLADAYSGKGIFLIKDVKDLRNVGARFENRAFSPHWRTLAVQYVPEKRGDLFFKTRINVIGQKVDMVSRNLDQNWICNFVGDGCEAQQLKENERYQIPRALECDAVETGKAIGLGIYVIDALEKDGKHYIVDVNPTYYFRTRTDLLAESMRQYWSDHPRRVVEYLTSLSQ